MDYNIKTEDGKTLAYRAVDSPIDVETFTTLDTFHCWNIFDQKGNTPIMSPLKDILIEKVEILLGCPRSKE